MNNEYQMIRLYRFVKRRTAIAVLNIKYPMTNLILTVTIIILFAGSPINPYQSWPDMNPIPVESPNVVTQLPLATAGVTALLTAGPPMTTLCNNDKLLHGPVEPRNDESLQNDEESGHLMTSPATDSNRYSTASPSSDQCSAIDIDQEPQRKRRHPVPEEKKDEKYWERRKRNNQAAKRSRDMKRKKTEDELIRAQDAVQENAKLKQEIEVLKAEINSLRRLLKDANMTLSLWIRARQASESASQLPPMLRNPNMSFVTFPVPSSK